MSTMTNQRASAIGVDMGAIYELHFTNRWNKPAEAYKLTPAMVEVADYADRTFHFVRIRETGEKIATREFKRTFKEKYGKSRFKGNRTAGSVRYSEYVGEVNGNHVHNYYKFNWYLTQHANNKLQLTAVFYNKEESVVVLDLNMEYSEIKFNLIAMMMRWITDQNISVMLNPRCYNDNYKFKPAVLKFFNT